jgi:hypothetical protein
MGSPKTTELVNKYIGRETAAKELSSPKMIESLNKYKTAFDKQMPFDEWKAKIDKLGGDTEWNEYKCWQMTPEENQLNAAKQEIWRTSKKEMIDFFSEKDPGFKKAYAMADTVYKVGKNDVVNKLVANMKHLVQADKFDAAVRKIIYPGMSSDELRAIRAAAAASPEAQGAIKASILKSIFEHSMGDYGEFQPKKFAKELRAWGTPLEEMMGAEKMRALENIKTVGKAAGADKTSVMLEKAKRAYFLTILNASGPNAFLLTPTGQRWINTITTAQRGSSWVQPKQKPPQPEEFLGDAINNTVKK